MGKKYESCALGSGSTVRSRLKFIIPASILLVFVLLNLSSLSPFDVASNGPVSYTILSDQDHHNVRDGRHELSRAEAEAIAAQYESLRSHSPSQITGTNEDPVAKYITEDHLPAKTEVAVSTESEEEEVPVQSESEATQEAPAQTEAKVTVEQSVEIPVATEKVEETSAQREDLVEAPVLVEDPEEEQTQEALAKSGEAPHVAERTAEKAPVQVETPVDVETPVRIEAPIRTEAVAPTTGEVAVSQTELWNLENSRLEASRNPHSGKTEEEENSARLARERDEGEEAAPVVEETSTEAIEPELLSLIMGDKTHLARTDKWKLGPLGSELKFLEYSIRRTMLPYTTRKSTSDESQTCDGRRVYVYDLPPEFNQNLVARCDMLFRYYSMCPYVTDFGRGVPVNSMDNGTQIFVPGNKWFNTHQYALEMISHARILKYKCRTDDRSKADLFYIPYYAGFDVIEWHFHPEATNEKKDALSLKLVSWLGKQKEFQLKLGKDHLLVLGKISWDFRRQQGIDWGSRMLEFPELKDVTRLLIERDPWCDHDIGVPHPTYFHPTSAADIEAWLAHISSQKREYLATFVGKERQNDPTNPRTALVRQCMNVTYSKDCKFVECVEDVCLHPAYVTRAFLNTHFCMQPPGDSSTRRSVFDSLVAGCIPVLFHPHTAYTQYPWHLPRNESLYSVFFPEEDVIAGTVNVIEELKKIPAEQRNAMREFIINTMIPGLIYSAPGADVSPYRDAFDISLDQVFHRTKVMQGLEQDQSQ